MKKIAIIGSGGYLEIAQTNGSAALLIGAKVDIAIIVRRVS